MNEDRNASRGGHEHVVLPLDRETALRGLAGVGPDAVWVVERDGRPHEYLSRDRTWGPVDQAWEFSSQMEANAAERPDGTTGTAVPVVPLPPGEPLGSHDN